MSEGKLRIVIIVNVFIKMHSMSEIQKAYLFFVGHSFFRKNVFNPNIDKLTAFYTIRINA